MAPYLTTDNDVVSISSEEEAGATWVWDRYNEGLKPLRGPQFNYWLNNAYLLGDQWVYWNRQSNSIDVMPTDDDRVQATINRLWPASRTIISKLVSRPLQFYVPPTGADDATIKAAKTAESILAAVHREHKWENLREDAAWAAWKGGSAAICVTWDPKAGTPLGQRDEDGKEFGTGDTVEEALAITDFVVEPGVRDAEIARWWIKMVALPPKQVQAQYNLDKEPPADASAATTPYMRKMIQSAYTQEADAIVPLTRVFTYYERPNALNKDGKVCVVVDGKIVTEDKWPFPFKDKLNLVVFSETRVEGTWLGETVMKAARPVQNAINQSWSSIIEHMKLAGNARLPIPQSMIDIIQELTDLPAELLPIPDGMENSLQWLSPPQMPQWWIEEPDRLRNELDDILGVHEVSRGDAPGRVESGLALSILVEQDSTPIGRLTKEMAGAFARLAELVLRIYEAKVKESRNATVKTPGQPPKTAKWTGKDLHGQVVAEVPLDAVMPRSKAAQEAQADKLMQMGLITTITEWARVADIPLDKDVLEAVSPDVAKARRENATMALGNVQIPEAFDDHNIHVGEHLTFMKSAEWDLLKVEEREIFRLHVQAHSVMSAEELGRQASLAMADPLLATASSPIGAPTVPMEALAAGALAPDEDPALAEQGVVEAISAQNPGIDPAIIAEGV